MRCVLNPQIATGGLSRHSAARATAAAARQRSLDFLNPGVPEGYNGVDGVGIGGGGFVRNSSVGRQCTNRAARSIFGRDRNRARGAHQPPRATPGVMGRRPDHEKRPLGALMQRMAVRILLCLCPTSRRDRQLYCVHHGHAHWAGCRAG